MILNKKTVNEFQKNGVVILRNIVEPKWTYGMSKNKTSKELLIFSDDIEIKHKQD